MGTATESENRVSRSDTQQKGSGGGSQGRSLATSAGQKGQGKSGNGDGLSNALGWFSIGLGLAQVTAPRGVARFIGVDDSDRNCNLMRAVGARELASGVGLLSQPRQPGWAWTRVAGDVMDLALLSSALTSDDNQRGRTSGATAAVLGVAVLDGIFGYSHMTGGFAGGQAEYARVPFADVGPLKIENGFTDDQVLFLSDILPTGYMGAEMCDIEPGDVIAVWGCGPVGQFAIASAYMLGAERVIAIDRFDYRLKMAREKAGAETINYMEVDSVVDTLKEMTGGRGPDACIDAVGMEAHGHGLEYAYDRTKQALMLETDHPIALREAIMACRNGGTVSVVGVYGGFIDKFPMGSLMNRSLTLKTGQCHVQRYMRPLLERIQNGDIDPTFVITHHMRLQDAPKGYDIFVHKEDNCEKIVLTA